MTRGDRVDGALERAVERGMLAAALVVIDAVQSVAEAARAGDEGDEIEQWRKVRDEVARRVRED